MKKIMFNTVVGLEEAVLCKYKDMTRRTENSLLKLGPNETITKQEPKKRTMGLSMYGITCRKGDKCACEYEYYTEITPRYWFGDVVAIAQSYNTVFSRLPEEERNQFINKVLREHGVCNHTGLQAWQNKYFVKAELMPRHIEITDVKIEKLQGISDVDCMREGVRKCQYGYYVEGMRPTNEDQWKYTDKTETHVLFKTPVDAFAHVIERTCGKTTWTANPFVAAYTFRLLD